MIFLGNLIFPLYKITIKKNNFVDKDAEVEKFLIEADDGNLIYISYVINLT